MLARTARHFPIVAILLLVTCSTALAQEDTRTKKITVAVSVNAMSTGDALAHKRLENDVQRLLTARLEKLDGLEVAGSNADLLLSVTVIQVDDEDFACSSISFAYSPACIGLVLFETGIYGKQVGLDRVVEAIARDFEVNTLLPYRRTKE